MTNGSRTPHEGDFALFRVARSPFEARIIVAVLEDAGIPAFVPGGLLVDEFAMSQRLMNLQGVEVHAPRARLEEAERALAAAKATGAELAGEVSAAAGEQDDVEADGAGPSAISSARKSRWPLLALFLVSLVMVVFAVLWLETRAELAAVQTVPPLLFENTADGIVARYLDTHRPAYRIVDTDRDGIAEEHVVYARDGTPVLHSFDVDENGVYERTEEIARDGRVAGIAADEDQDGRLDVFTNRLPDGLELVWTDSDRDSILDRLEVRRDGETIGVQELRGEEGYRTVR